MTKYRNQSDVSEPRTLPEYDSDYAPIMVTRNFVAPEPQRQLPTPVQPPPISSSMPVVVDAVFTPVHGAVEHTSAMDRARALRVRLVPFLVGWAGLSLVVGGVTLFVANDVPKAALLTVLAFSALTSVTYYKLNRTDYDYSREGTERHRLDVAADLAHRQMSQEYELRRLALVSYLKTLGVDHDGKK